MANLKSSQKDTRRIERRTLRNRMVKSRMKTLRKKAEGLAVTSDKAEEAAKVGSNYVASLDKAVKRNVIHPNKAARLKSRLAKLQNAHAGPAPVEAAPAEEAPAEEAPKTDESQD